MQRVRAGISWVTSVFLEQLAEPVCRTALRLLSPRFDRVSSFLSHDMYQLPIHISIEWNRFIVAFWDDGSKEIVVFGKAIASNLWNWR